MDAIRLWPSPWNTRIVFDLSQEVKYSVIQLERPTRVVIDLNLCEKHNKFFMPTITDSGVEQIRVGVHPDKLRIVLETDQKYTVNAFIVPPNQHYGHRLVIDLDTHDKATIMELFEHQDKEATHSSKFVVAIDPGHGAEDPGAIGPMGTREKDVVLDIALKLARFINQHHRMQAVLTRENDYFLSLEQRVAQARKNKADLLVSIHADAYIKRSVYGASVFTLSEKGATSAMGKILADSENRADFVGGVNYDTTNNTLMKVLLDLSQTASKQQSKEAGLCLLQSLEQIVPMHQKSVEQAGFAVLKAPDVPSILVEVGFISHPKTEQKLRQESYKLKIAEALSRGIDEYFKHKTPRDHDTIEELPQNYTVQPGDTLSALCVKYRVSSQKMHLANPNLKEKLLVGQKIIIPYE